MKKMFGTALMATLAAFIAAPALAGGGCGGGSSYTKAAPANDIVETAMAAGSFDTLVAAVKAADLVEVLKSDGPFTVFAPTDAAFAKLPPGTLQALLADKDKLVAILTYHVVPGAVTASEVTKLSSAKTVQGQRVHIDTAYGVKVDQANVIKTDILASNGIIHVIDSVILPTL